MTHFCETKITLYYCERLPYPVVVKYLCEEYALVYCDVSFQQGQERQPHLADGGYQVCQNDEEIYLPFQQGQERQPHLADGGYQVFQNDEEIYLPFQQGQERQPHLADGGCQVCQNDEQIYFPFFCQNDEEIYLPFFPARPRKTTPLGRWSM